MNNDVARFTFDALVWPDAVGDTREMSSCGCTALPNKEFLLPRSEISSSSGSRAIDAPPSSEISSYSTASCVSPDVTEGSSYGAILKPGGGAVFVCDYSSLRIWRHLLAMVAVSSSLPCALAYAF